METKYKVVRDDYTDCYSGKVKFTVGETVTVEKPDGPSMLCGRGLHACHKPADCLRFRNGAWPVRLLEVETDSIIAQDETKCRCASLRVVSELPLSDAFGPNGEAVCKHLEAVKNGKWFKPQAECRERITSLLAEHFERLKPYGLDKPYPVRFVGNRKDADAAWDAAGAVAWGVAWDVAWDAARAVARAVAWDAAWGVARAVAWDVAWDAAWDAARDVAWDAAWDAAWAAARAVARDAAWDAVWLVAADLIPNPNPFAPLFEVWQLGAWPIGVVKGEFVVFLPPVECESA